jgi:hypothetical protein
VVPNTANDATIAPAGATAGYTVSIAAGEVGEARNLTINDSHATLDDAGSLMLNGGLNLEAGTFHLNGGILDAGSPITIASGAVFDGGGVIGGFGHGVSVSGTIIADNTGGHELDFAEAVSGSGNFHVAAGATMEFSASVATGATVTFDGIIGTLKLDAPESFNATIVNFHGNAPDVGDSDAIDLAGINFNSGHFTQSYDTTTGVMSVSDGTHSATLTFQGFAGDDSNFTFATDGNGGTLILDPPTSQGAGASNTPAAKPAPLELGDSFHFQPNSGAPANNGGFDHGPGATGQGTFTHMPTGEHWTQQGGSDGHSPIGDAAHDNHMPAIGTTPAQFQAMLVSLTHVH